MKLLRTTFLILTALLLFTMATPHRTGTGRIYPKILCLGQNSGMHEEKTVTIGTQNEFISAWKKLAGPEAPRDETPSIVDLQKYAIIVHYAGDQTNGVELDSAYVIGDELILSVSRVSLGPKCKGSRLLVTPFIMLQVEKGSWKTCRVKTHVVSQNCD
jgi:hypothetical protein